LPLCPTLQRPWQSLELLTLPTLGSPADALPREQLSILKKLLHVAIIMEILCYSSLLRGQKKISTVYLYSQLRL
jgi:hypothetical protein